jgi:hypothetical protein
MGWLAVLCVMESEGGRGPDPFPKLLASLGLPKVSQGLAGNPPVRSLPCLPQPTQIIQTPGRKANQGREGVGSIIWKR